MTNKTPISQSLIKSIEQYKNGQYCGLLIKANWIDGLKTESTPNQKLGQYFEYMATGQPDYYGEIPDPVYLKDGVTLTAPYRRAKEQAENFKKYLKEYKWTIISAGKKWVKDGMTALTDCEIKVSKEGVWPFKGAANLTYEANNGEFVLDLKFSGLIDDKWNEFGWDRNNLLKSTNRNAMQAQHYPLVTGKPFAFFVFSSGKDMGARLIPTISENPPGHLQRVKSARNMVDHNVKNGWTAHPDLVRCRECPLFENCPERVTAPIPESLLII